MSIKLGLGLGLPFAQALVATVIHAASLLMESGSYLLLESGSNILLE
jgi:hypothetical protein